MSVVFGYRDFLRGVSVAPKHWEIFLRAAATFTVEVAGRLAYSEELFPVVEFAVHSRNWSIAQSQENFVFKSMEWDEPRLDWIKEDTGVWQIGSAPEVVMLIEIQTALDAFYRRVREAVKAAFEVDIQTFFEWTSPCPAGVDDGARSPGLGLRVDHSSLSKSPAGAIHCLVCFETANRLFPDKDWTEVAIPFVSAWAGAVTRIAAGKTRKETMVFPEGPFSVDLAGEVGGVLKARLVQRRIRIDKVIESVEAPIDSVLRNAVATAQELLRACRERGWTDDCADLAKAANALAILTSGS